MKTQTNTAAKAHSPISVTLRMSILAALLFVSTNGMAQQPVDRGCEAYQAWQMQSNPRADADGVNNHALPDANATYWGTVLNFPLGTVVSLKGQFPQARYISFQVYDENGSVLGSLNDVSINPDFGQNNPFRGGIAQGAYTVRLVFGAEPFAGPAPNTIYTGRRNNNVGLVYRVYYPTDRAYLADTPVDPILPRGTAVDAQHEGILLPGFPSHRLHEEAVNVPAVRAFVTEAIKLVLGQGSTLIGRLDNIDYVGITPSTLINPQLPSWQFSVSPLYPYQNEDNAYLSAFITRAFLQAPYNYDMVVIRLKTPTFTNTQAGVPPYAPANVRYWSICQNETQTSSVVACIPDNAAATLNGFATFVISDPSRHPSDATLRQWGATWLPWGALMPGDVITDRDLSKLDNSDGVFYRGLILYRQTMADPTFAESIKNVSKLPERDRQAAMRDYWPSIGYCTTAAFNIRGANCLAN